MIESAFVYCEAPRHDANEMWFLGVAVESATAIGWSILSRSSPRLNVTILKVTFYEVRRRRRSFACGHEQQHSI